MKKPPKEGTKTYNKIVKLGCFTTRDDYVGDCDCGYGYEWLCDYCPVTIESNKLEKENK